MNTDRSPLLSVFPSPLADWPTALVNQDGTGETDGQSWNILKLHLRSTVRPEQMDPATETEAHSKTISTCLLRLTSSFLIPSFYIHCVFTLTLHSVFPVLPTFRSFPLLRQFFISSSTAKTPTSSKAGTIKQRGTGGGTEGGLNNVRKKEVLRTTDSKGGIKMQEKWHINEREERSKVRGLERDKSRGGYL